jgi:hypothetical protein
MPVFTPEQVERIESAIREKMPGACPLCSQRDWAIGRGITLLLAVAPPSASTLSKVTYTYPALPVMCRVCGNTLLMNVYVLGIADMWPEQLPTVPDA